MTVDRTAVDRAAEVIERSLLVEVNGGELEPIWQIYKPEGVALVIRQALMNAGLLVDDQWVHVSCAGYTAPDMFEAFFAGIRWLADRVEVVDGEIDMPSEDQPGVVGMDHGEACGDWLNDYDADTGRVNDDGEYVRPVLVDDLDRAVLDAAEALRDISGDRSSNGTMQQWAEAGHSLAAAVDARRAANGSER